MVAGLRNRPRGAGGLGAGKLCVVKPFKLNPFSLNPFEPLGLEEWGASGVCLGVHQPLETIAL